MLNRSSFARPGTGFAVGAAGVTPMGRFLMGVIAPGMIRFAAAAACIAALRAEETSETADALALAREGEVAEQAKDYEVWLAKTEAAVALRPEFPRLLANLAAAQVANEKPEEAIATLNRLAALGMYSPVDGSEEFAALRGQTGFADVAKKLANNLVMQGRGRIAFTLRDVTGLIEGIAWREKTGEFFFGDVNGRAVWVRGKDGNLRQFSPEGDELLGVFGLAVDEDRGTLWAATSAVRGMRGFTRDQDGTAALTALDLESGAIRRTIAVVRAEGDQQTHVLGDLAIARDGTVFVTDSRWPVLWKLAPDGDRLERFVDSAEFLSLQGVVVAPGGEVLIVSDHSSGLLRVDVASGKVQRFAPPPNTTLIGIDGMALAPDGSVFAIQNGTRPIRVLRIAFDSAYEEIASVTVLESGHMNMPAPSLGCIATGGAFYYVGNAAWTRFEFSDGEPTEPRLVPIFVTQVENPGRARGSGK
jgi:sugar lactone lactonase YvrE